MGEEGGVSRRRNREQGDGDELLDCHIWCPNPKRRELALTGSSFPFIPALGSNHHGNLVPGY